MRNREEMCSEEVALTFRIIDDDPAISDLSDAEWLTVRSLLLAGDVHLAKTSEGPDQLRIAAGIAESLKLGWTMRVASGIGCYNLIARRD